MPTGDVQDEAARGVEKREGARDDGGDGELVGDQRRPVVDETLGFDERDQAAGQAEPLRDRSRRGRVGRRDGSAPTTHAVGQLRSRDQSMRGGRDREGRRQHEADREQPDRTRSSGAARGAG